MFLILLLLMIALILIAVTVIAVSVGGSVFILVFSDVIVCIGFIIWLIDKQKKIIIEDSVLNALGLLFL